MTICNIGNLPGDLKARIPKGQRLLGLDPGTKTIGVALSDVSWMIASPYATIARQSWVKDIDALVRIIDKEGVGGVVMGLPVQMDGTEGERAAAARKLAAKLLERKDLPLIFQDERLSTAAVQRMMVVEMDLSRKKRQAAVDKAAAAYILQGALDGMR